MFKIAQSVSVVKVGRLVIIKSIVPTHLAAGKEDKEEAVQRPASLEKTSLKPLDRRKIEAAIAQDGSGLGICPEFAPIKPQVAIHTFESLPSTNTHLWKMLAAGAKSGTIVIAQQQSAGRGQRNRQWDSSPGGLYLSVALAPNWPISHSAQLTCLSAWGIATALNNLGIAVQIKWPNDLYFQGKKLGGILTETKLSSAIAANTQADTQADSYPSSATIKQAVIGVGINWYNPVPESGISLATILETTEAVPKFAKNKINCLEVLIAVVIRGILQGVIFQQQVGSQVFMKTYQKLLTQIGQPVSLDSNGHLSLSVPLSAPWEQSLVQLPSVQMPLPAITPVASLSSSDSIFQQATSSQHTRQIEIRQTDGQNRWANRSGEVVGVSEEGYLQVALYNPLHAKTNCSKPRRAMGSDEEILLLRPSEIHVS